MELIEFIIFLSVNIILLLISLSRKGILFSLLGFLSCLFILPLILTNGLIIERVYITNATGIMQTTPIYADTSIVFFTFTILGICHALAMIRGATKE